MEKPMSINLSDYYGKISNEVGGYQVIHGDEEVECFIGSSEGIAELFNIDLDGLEYVPDESNTLVIGNFCLAIEGPGVDVKLDAVNTLLDFSFREWLTKVLEGPEQKRADFDFGIHRVTIQKVVGLGHVVAYVRNGIVEKTIELLGGPHLLTGFPGIYHGFKDLVVLTPGDLKEEINIPLYFPVENDKEALYWM